MTVLIAGDNGHLFSTPVQCIGEENTQMIMSTFNKGARKNKCKEAVNFLKQFYKYRVSATYKVITVYSIITI